MSNLLQSVDDRTRLAGTNRLEVLLFSLGVDNATGRDEVFGINVFKVREVMHIPAITRAPDMPDSIEGIVGLRGAIMPVINLQKFCGIRTADEPKILMVTEYNKHVQGFLVNAVDTIERLDWQDVKAPPAILANRLEGLVTAVAELKDERIVMIVDVEKVLADAAVFYEDDSLFAAIQPHQGAADITVLFADDSSVARRQITKTLEHMGLKHLSANNGSEAWSKLNEIATRAQAAGRPITEDLSLVLTDVEMPEMDGYVLTQKIKSDPRFQGIHVVMHSSLTSDENQVLGKGVGADAYVPKFEPVELAATLEKMIPKLRG